MKHLCIYCKETGEIKYAEEAPSTTKEDAEYLHVRSEALYLQAVMDSGPDETWVFYIGDEPYIHEVDK